MSGEVYRENSSDDAQGYQPFTTYSENYLTCANFYGYFILIHKFGEIVKMFSYFPNANSILSYIIS